MTHVRLGAALALAATQHDVITAQQLAELGVDRSAVTRLVRSGILVRIGGPGILRIAGGTASWHQQVLSAALAAGPGAAASHRSGGTLWKLDGIDVQAVELSVPRGCRRRPSGATIRQSTDLGPGQITTVDGIPVTEPTRTLIDLAGVLQAADLELAYDSALRMGLTSVDRSRRMLDRLARPGRHGIGPFTAMLDRRAEVDGITETVFEARTVQVLLDHGLPRPVPQVELFDEDGFIGRFDVTYPPAKVAIEADSVRWHTSRQRFEEDRARRARAEAIGWRLPSFTWKQVTRRPLFVATTVERMLAVAGWDWRNARADARLDAAVSCADLAR